jgi:hypothetical protein
VFEEGDFLLGRAFALLDVVNGSVNLADELPGGLKRLRLFFLGLIL